MPIYEYRCAQCGFQDEYLQKVSEARLTVCPSCGKSAFEKQLSAAGFQLKGSGWYATDFKGGRKPAPDAEAAKSDAKSESKSEAKSEAKSEGKTESKSEGKSESKSEGKSESKSEGKSESKSEGKSEGKVGGKSEAAKGDGAPSPASTTARTTN